MHTFIFSNHAHKNFLKLSKETQDRISQKLRTLKSHDDILAILKRLHGFEPATHRLRVGNYRLVLELKQQEEQSIEFWILDVGHRKDIYK